MSTSEFPSASPSESDGYKTARPEQRGLDAIWFDTDHQFHGDPYSIAGIRVGPVGVGRHEYLGAVSGDRYSGDPRVRAQSQLHMVTDQEGNMVYVEGKGWSPRVPETQRRDIMEAIQKAYRNTINFPFFAPDRKRE